MKLRHDAAVGMSNPSISQIDPTEAQVISYVVSAQCRRERYSVSDGHQQQRAGQWRLRIAVESRA